MPRPLLAIDTETTGVDAFHGSHPFLVTTCRDDGSQRWWEWAVDPLTRLPEVDPDDLQEIADLVLGVNGPTMIGQNLKFDVTALQTLFTPSQQRTVVGSLEWPWDRTFDTLIAGHLLASNQSHKLKDMATMWLGTVGKKMEQLEDALEVACKECRREVQQAKLRVKRRLPKSRLDNASIVATIDTDEPLASWRIADEGLEEMPSVTTSSSRDDDKPWKNDCWLPKAMAEFLNLSPNHSYRTVTRDYANGDSAATMMLWKVQQEELKRRGLWNIFLERMKLPRITQRIEARAVTGSITQAEQLHDEHVESSEAAAAACVEMAHGLGFDLQLPKGATNNSLKEFCFEVLKLPVAVWTETGQPALNKEAFAFWMDTLPHDSTSLEFIKTLQHKKVRDTQVAFLEGYRRFWLPLRRVPDNEPPYCHICEFPATGPTCNGCGAVQLHNFFKLHSNLNPTGTATLRFAMYNPNTSNVSKRVLEKEELDGTKTKRSIRWAFGPAPGREWWTFDGENLELRLPAYLSGEQELIELFERPNDPPYFGSQHIMNFQTIYPELWDEAVRKVGIEKAASWIKSKEGWADTWYQWVKNGDFAIQYQAGDETADRAFHRKGAKALIKKRFAKQNKLNQDTVQFAEKHGYVETIPDITVDPLHGYPLLCTRTDRGSILPTIPLSYKIQGSAGWWISKAMVRVDEQHNKWGRQAEPSGMFDGFITLQVHDELDLDWPIPAGPSGGDPSADLKREKETGILACDWTKSSKSGLVPDRGTSNLWRARIVQRLVAQGGADFGMPGKTPVGVEWHPNNWQEGVAC